MLELVRYQKAELPKAIECEEEILQSAQIFKSEKNGHGKLEKYVEVMTYSVSWDTKKKVFFNEYIWGL